MISKNLNILVYGDAILDKYSICSIKGMSTEAPVPIVKITDENYVLGGAANVANNIVSLSSNCFLCTTLSDDSYSSILVGLLDKSNISKELITFEKSRITTLKNRFLVNNSQLLRVDSEVTNPISKESIGFLSSNLEPVFSKLNGVVISDYSKGTVVFNLVEELITLSKKYNIPIIVESKNYQKLPLNGVWAIKPNLKELQKETNLPITNLNEIKIAVKYLFDKVNPQNLVLTMGDKGILLFNSNGFQLFQAKKVQIADVTGAGDTVAASLILSLSSGLTIEEACKIANVAASIVVSKQRVSTLTINELESAVK